MPNIVIESDGTKSGTKLTVDGQKVNNLSDINFSVFMNSSYDNDIWFSYAVSKKDKEKGMSVRTTYTLDPAKASIIMEEGSVDPNNPTADDFAKM